VLYSGQDLSLDRPDSRETLAARVVESAGCSVELSTLRCACAAAASCGWSLQVSAQGRIHVIPDGDTIGMCWESVLAVLNDLELSPAAHCRVITPDTRRRPLFLACFAPPRAPQRSAPAGPWLVRDGRRFVVNGSGRLLTGYG